jgi:hypothetical protein
MIASAWHNGQSPHDPGSYGIRVSVADRDKFMSSEWTSITLVLSTVSSVEIAPTPSFWRKCPEFRSVIIGQWLLDSGAAPWPKGKPPRIALESLGKAKFSVEVLRAALD